VFSLGGASLLNDLSSEMILPILPFFITSLGGGGMAIGLIGGLRDSFADFLKAFFGYLSDKYKNRSFFIFAGYLTASVFKIFLTFAHTWQLVLLAVGCERIGKSMRSAPRNALLIQSTPNNIGLSFGITRALDTLGALLGSCVTFVLLNRLNFSLTAIIFIASIISFTSIIPLFWLKEPTESPTDNLTPLPSFSFASFKKLPSNFKLFLIITSTFALGHISYMFMMLKANSLFDGHPVATTMMLYIIFNIVYTLSAVPAGNFSDILGRRIMLQAGYGLFAITMFLLIWATAFYHLIICFMLYGLAIAFIEVNHRAYAADLAPAYCRATALGVFEGALGLAMMAAGLIAGALWEMVGNEFVFAYASVLATGAVIMLTVLRKKL